MSLGKKTLVLFFLLGLSLCLGGYAVNLVALLPTFEEFEEKSSHETVARVLGALDADLTALDVMNLEYSSWDDTYAYVLGRKPGYLEENLDTPYLQDVGVHLVLIYDAQGNGVHSYFARPDDGEQLSLALELPNLLAMGHPLVTHPDSASSVSGLLEARSGLMQVVSRPILTSESRGPIAGSLVVGHFITRDRVLELGRRVTADLSLVGLDTPDIPLRIEAILPQLSAAGGRLTVESGGDELREYRLLPNVLGVPASVLEITTPRSIMHIGATTIRTATLLLAIASTVFLLTAWLFTQRLIVVPINALTRKILDIRKTGELRFEVDVDRPDEVGVLAREFSAMTSELGRVRLELEEARDRALDTAKAKSDFLARMSHEIRTPMNGVLGMTELLRDTPLEEEQERVAASIHQSAVSLLDIINEILDFSKIEAGKLDLELQEVDLHCLVTETVGGLESQAHQKGLTLVVVTSPKLETTVLADALRLRQVLTNLLSNAIKFTSEGKVAVRVDAVEDGREHLRVRFEVSDTGIGIEPESLEAIFDSFTQADGTTTRLYGGTGLGLAISRQLVDMMGGRLEVESVHGEGSTFSFTALMEVGRPLGLEDATGSEDLSEPRMGEQSSLTGRVLLAEDNPVNQAVAIGLLEGLGVSTVIATDGWDAVEKATSDEFDIVLMDCQMPVTDGYQATELIRRRERERGGRRLPIVAVTANALQGDREKCLASGMDAYLPKPFSAKDLHSVLRTFLDPAVAERPTEASSEAPADDGTDVEHELDYALDPSVLAALADCQGSGEPNFVKKTVDAYLSHSSRIVTDLGAAVDAMDSASILENAHALGSSSANVGATELARLCLGLEVMARDGDLAEAPGLRSEIDREYQRVAVALEAETSSVTAAI